MKTITKTNPQLRDLIKELRELSKKQNVKIWKRIADDLNKSTRRKREVNLERINRVTKENEIIVIPGKVLASGDLKHKVTIAAFQFSEKAREVINKNGKALTIQELIKKNPKGSGVRIIG